MKEKFLISAMEFLKDRQIFAEQVIDSSATLTKYNEQAHDLFPDQITKERQLEAKESRREFLSKQSERIGIRLKSLSKKELIYFQQVTEGHRAEIETIRELLKVLDSEYPMERLENDIAEQFAVWNIDPDNADGSLYNRTIPNRPNYDFFAHFTGHLYLVLNRRLKHHQSLEMQLVGSAERQSA